MNIEVGQSIKRKKDVVKVLAIARSFIQVENERGHEFWVRREELESGTAVPAPDIVQKTEATPKGDIIVIDTINPALLPYVTKLRIVYPEKSQVYLNEQAAKNGVLLDPRTRPVRAGLRGGHTIQRSPAATVEFGAEVPVALLPASYKVLPKGGYRVNSIAVAFALLKAGAKQTAFA